DLVLGQTAEVVQLDDAGLALVELGELVEGLVERDQLRRSVDGDARLIEFCRALAGASLVGAALAGVVDEDLPHAARGDREEVRALVEFELRASARPEAGLGAQGGGR